jgi:TetR/AcrR family transcriptional regulator
MSGEDRRKQLIEVAIDLFSKKGFGGTTTREIAAAAGVTEAIIFRHFANKQDLYTAILDYKGMATGAEEWLTEAEVFMDREDDEGLFRLILTKVIEVHRTEPQFERLMIHAALEGHELAVMHHQIHLTVGARIADYIERRQRAGALVKADPMTILYAVAGVAQMYAMQKYMYQRCPPQFSEEISDETMINEFLRILMSGLRGAV